MTDQERKATLEALDIVEKTLKGAPAPAFEHWRPYLYTIRAALTPSPKTCGAVGKEACLTRDRIAEDCGCSAAPYKDYTWEDVAMLAQENRALKEAATAQRCEWQPIETAPLNFNAILVRSQAGNIYHASHNPETMEWSEIVTGDWLNRPTHWMPLPAAPVDKSAEQHPTKGETP